MAAQAVDFTLSGHVSRALVITDADESTTSFQDWGSSPTRFRMEGETEIEGGTSAGLKIELGQGPNLREAHVYVSGDGLGKIALGDASEAADTRAFSDKSGAFVAHGQEMGAITTGDYFDAMSGGTTEGLHYTSPALGPITLEASAGNDDRWSASLVLDTEAAGTAVRGEVGVLEYDNEVTEEKSRSIGASIGTKFANGLTWSASWAKGTNIGGAAATPRQRVSTNTILADEQWAFSHVNSAGAIVTTHSPYVSKDLVGKGRTVGNLVQHTADFRAKFNELNVGSGDFDNKLTTTAQKRAWLRGNLAAPQTWMRNAGIQPPTQDSGAYNVVAVTTYLDAQGNPQPLTNAHLDAILEGKDLNPTVNANGPYNPILDGSVQWEANVAIQKAAVPSTDPSYVQTTIGYVVGDTSFALGWYRSRDFVNAGSKGTIVGLGVNHNLPTKVNAHLFATVQQYRVEDGATDTSDTVLFVGSRIKF